MVFKDEQQVIEYIKANQAVPKWVTDARNVRKTNDALINGVGFIDELIKRIEKIESEDRAEARRKYSKDIRDLFSRVFEPRHNVFFAHGSSLNIDIKGEKVKERFSQVTKNFKGNKSIDAYLSDNFFNFLDVDPNGLLMMEYVKDEKIEPTYKSINDIRNYESNGQIVHLILFEPVDVKANGAFVAKKWRLVDEEKEWCILQKGESFSLVSELTFKHPFKGVPALILSDDQITGSEVRKSPIFYIQELAKDYARDKSVLTLYKFLRGSPIQWRYSQICRRCHGVGKMGNDKCGTCDGTGKMGKNDVTDIIDLPLPRDSDDAKIAPDLAGFVAPDLKTWEQYKIDLKDFEEQMISTIWGTNKAKDGGNETATGRFIDVQPVTNKLNKFTDLVEWSYNKMLEWVLEWMDKNKKSSATKTFGRSFIIETPDILLERYTNSVKAGLNVTVLDRLLSEYLTSKYKNNPIKLEVEFKKSRLEPYVHMTIDQVDNIFGREESSKKYLFGLFWNQADVTKDEEVLKEEFELFVNENLILNTDNNGD